MALHFNSDSGTDDYLNKSVAVFSGKTYPLAFVAWVRPDDRGAQYAVASDSGSGTSKQIRLGAGSSGKFIMGMRGSSAQSPSAHYSNSNTTWFHLVGAFIDNNDQKLYVNGTLDQTQTSSADISDFADSDEFYIGTGVQSGTNITGRTWEGGIAEVAAYAAELTAGEISALAAGFSPLLVRPDALVGYWPLGGPLASIASNNDFVGGNYLTTNGSPSEENHPPMIYPSAPILARKPLVVAEPVTADGSVSEYLRTPDTSGGFTKPYDTSSTYSRDTDTTGTFTRPSE
tara:strand:+ start:2017 stop:2877 length:861 start_codon:yes stop_codon:yes gene_type:complete